MIFAWLTLKSWILLSFARFLKQTKLNLLIKTVLLFSNKDWVEIEIGAVSEEN
jgi:hypothetical protein